MRIPKPQDCPMTLHHVYSLSLGRQICFPTPAPVGEVERIVLPFIKIIPAACFFHDYTHFYFVMSVVSDTHESSRMAGGNFTLCDRLCFPKMNSIPCALLTIDLETPPSRYEIYVSFS